MFGPTKEASRRRYSLLVAYLAYVGRALIHGFESVFGLINIGAFLRPPVFVLVFCSELYIIFFSVVFVHV